MPTVLFDNVVYTRRVDVPIALLSLFQQIPGAASERLEVFRGVTTVDHLQKFVLMLCRNLDYYPTREEAVAAIPHERAAKS